MNENKRNIHMKYRLKRREAKRRRKRGKTVEVKRNE